MDDKAKKIMQKVDAMTVRQYINAIESGEDLVYEIIVDGKRDKFSGKELTSLLCLASAAHRTKMEIDMFADSALKKRKISDILANDSQSSATEPKQEPHLSEA